MSNPSFTEDHFVSKARALITENLSDEQFGVSELAEAMNMSRSSLLRNIRKHANLSASQFIRQVRLEKGMELLKDDSLNVSEVAYRVGFGSTSYFTKCFREHFGYPPGEVSKMDVSSGSAETSMQKKKLWKILLPVLGILVLVAIALYKSNFSAPEITPEKSIVVLPFMNESSDSTNVYFINGLMQATLTNLQKIEDFRVVSRTSAETYRNSERSIPEIAGELDVNYVVEGSGQREGDQVLLNIQLIEASTDRPIWAEQYRRKVVDVFALQNEIAKNIADAVKAVVTPAELEQIEKTPTDDLVAYDYYLQALDPFHEVTREGLEKAIPLFEKAIEQDPEFSLAYADLAISYYFLDIYQKQKQYTEQINNYADKALLYDSRSAESLIAKALYYMHAEEFRLALPHLEKALEYNPNSSAVVQMLADLYARVIPNTSKYLEYALKGIQLDIAANDSVGKSYIYLHLSNALVQSGFVEEALTYVNKSLDFDPENYYSPLVKAYILYARDRDLDQTRDLLLWERNKDTTRLDILQEVAKVYYYKEAYDSAFYYFDKFVHAREERGLDIYQHEDVKIAWVYRQKGLDTQAAGFFESYAEHCEEDQSIYKSASLAIKYAYEGKQDEAIEQLRIFSQQDNFQYWILLFLEQEPILKPLKGNPEYEAVLQKIEARFWENHDTLKTLLESKGLL